QYLYENAGFPSHLTGKINEKGVRLATWNYDTNGRAISSEHGQSLEKVDLDYSVDNQTRVTHHISDTLTNDVIYHYEERFIGKSKRKLVTQYEQLACTDCEVGSWTYKYDANGYVSQSTSPTGVITKFTHDADGFETQRIEAYGTPEQQTIDTVWDTTKRRVSSVSKGNLKTEYFYDANNQVSSLVVT
ncbi:RHS repeat protein, partial [Aliikangiella sp. G2MR2-5]|uniref:RHS repeat protein n=1 Tax=Aliikangiella sp. G2MR2-5 TaxID=2788943 RepID=UPI0018ABD54D